MSKVIPTTQPLL